METVEQLIQKSDEEELETIEINKINRTGRKKLREIAGLRLKDKKEVLLLTSLSCRRQTYGSIRLFDLRSTRDEPGMLRTASWVAFVMM